MPFSVMLGASIHRLRHAMQAAMQARLFASMGLCIAACGPHSGAKQEATGKDCAVCHADEAAATTQPPHLQAMFGQDCAICHDEERFRPALGFVHTAAFPLTLAHAKPACIACHADTFAPGAVANQCVDCHAERAASVANPIHAGLSENCFACHRTDAFLPSLFLHAWPLEGAHVQATCTGCHLGVPAQYEGTATACASCHLDDRARADATVQGHGGFPSKCEGCHNVEQF